MAELTPPTLPPADKGNGAHVWVLPKSNPNPQGSIPAPAGGPGYGPYGGEACFFGYGPYSYGYHCRTPAQLQPQPQVNVSGNGFVENRGKVEMEVVQGHTSVFALVRRGTGVFHPPPRSLPFPNNNKTRGLMAGTWKKQGAHQAWRSRNASKGNDGLVKQEEYQHTPSPEIGLPKEWTY